jgi:hypothetical protein
MMGAVHDWSAITCRDMREGVKLGAFCTGPIRNALDSRAKLNLIVQTRTKGECDAGKAGNPI